jgi:hypothetical protein
MTRWRAGPGADASAASFLWLFCWAKTGMNSEAARLASVEAFEEIFGLRFKDVDHRVDHGWARQMRYRADLPDADLAPMLSGLEQKPRTR